MFIKQFYTNCLAEAAYYIESAGQAAVIDPLRDINAYIELAKERGAEIKFIFETHFHADFVSGHLDLASATGGQIVYGPTAKADFEFHEASDNEEFKLGNVIIQALHTPGHTMESTSFLLYDESNHPHAIFTGDTLFVGDVGRPDLAANANMDSKDLAGMLYDSIQNKILNLPNSVIVFPGHGAGSQCGKNLGEETASTIGTQRRTNYALAQENKEDFVRAVTDELLPPPQYFFKNAAINKSGYDALDKVLDRELVPLSVKQFKNEMQNGTLVIDSRHSSEYCNAHIPGSINIGSNGFFAVWVGTLIEELDTPIVIVAEQGKEEEMITRLARVGYENVRGYLLGGIESWMAAREKVEQLPSINAAEFQERQDDYLVIDVRNPGEYEPNMFRNSKNIPLSNFKNEIAELPDEPMYLVCKSGYRSAIAGSIMESLGRKNFKNITGGVDAFNQPISV